MENITFKYKNGRFVIKESYGAMIEADLYDSEFIDKITSDIVVWFVSRGIELTPDETEKITSVTAQALNKDQEADTDDTFMNPQQALTSSNEDEEEDVE